MKKMLTELLIVLIVVFIGSMLVSIGVGLIGTNIKELITNVNLSTVLSCGFGLFSLIIGSLFIYNTVLK